MKTIEDAKDLEGYVIYAGDLLPFLWTHLVVYPNVKAAKIGMGTDPKMKVVPVKDVFHMESYMPWGEFTSVKRVASKPGIPREVRLRK